MGGKKRSSVNKRNDKLIRHKKAGCGSRLNRATGHPGNTGMSGHSHSRPAWKIDTAHIEAQESAFLAELALQPEPTIGQRIKCKIGSHGSQNVRVFKVFWVNTVNGERQEQRSSIQKCFCVCCGHRWERYAVKFLR